MLSAVLGKITGVMMSEIFNLVLGFFKLQKWPVSGIF